jgi:hypothetical protein
MRWFIQCINAITLSCRRPTDHGLASPVLFVIGGWMYRVGRKEEAGDEEDEVEVD